MSRENRRIVILLSGKARSGKDTVTGYAVEEADRNGLRALVYRISQPMKEWASNDFMKLSEVLERIADEIRPYVDHRYVSAVDKLIVKPQNWFDPKTDITRCLLQIYGTDIFQNRVDPDWWSMIAAKEIEAKFLENANIVIVPDCRWPSNIDYIQSDIYETFTVRINRDDVPESHHPSECALDDYSGWDAVIDNNGTLEELRKTVYDKMSRLRLH